MSLLPTLPAAAAVGVPSGGAAAADVRGDLALPVSPAPLLLAAAPASSAALRLEALELACVNPRCGGLQGRSGATVQLMAATSASQQTLTDYDDYDYLMMF